MQTYLRSSQQLLMLRLQQGTETFPWLRCLLTSVDRLGLSRFFIRNCVSIFCRLPASSATVTLCRTYHIDLAKSNMQRTGAPIPQSQLCISPISDSPVFSEFLGVKENLSNFSQKVFFIHENFWHHFLVIDCEFQISRLFSLKRCISPLFGEIYYFSQLFKIVPPDFVKFTYFLHTLHVFHSPTLTMMHLYITQCTYWAPLTTHFLVASLSECIVNVRFTMHYDNHDLEIWVSQHWRLEAPALYVCSSGFRLKPVWSLGELRVWVLLAKSVRMQILVDTVRYVAWVCNKGKWSQYVGLRWGTFGWAD